jgi:hypothetical protein
LSPTLNDERRHPTFRELFSELLGQASRLDTAILRVRLGAIELATAQLRKLEGIRILVAEVNMHTLEWEAHTLLADRNRAGLVYLLSEFLASRRLMIRSAPLAGWSPDFSVFSTHSKPTAVVIGPHSFHPPFPHRGPAWISRFGSVEAERARIRFDEMWAAAHDIDDAFGDLLRRALEAARSAPKNTVPEGMTDSSPPLGCLDTPCGFG